MNDSKTFMEILETRTLRGPNYWSGYWKKLIIMRLDIGDYEKKPTDKIEGFYERMVEVMPSLRFARLQLPGRGRISSARRGGNVGRPCDRAFCARAADACRDGHRLRPDARDGRKGNLQRRLQLHGGGGRPFAGRAAVRLFGDLAEASRLDEIKEIARRGVQEMREIREDVRFGPSTGSLVEEAESRDIPYIRLNDQSLVQLGYGVHQKRIQATTTANTNMIAVDIAGNKHATKKLLGEMGVPVPKGYRIRESRTNWKNTVEAVGYPVVIKPLDGNHGKGATVGITTSNEHRCFRKGEGIFALDHCRKAAGRVPIFGRLVVNNRLIAVAERIPAHVTGDGKSTIQQLDRQDERRSATRLRPRKCPDADRDRRPDDAVHHEGRLRARSRTAQRRDTSSENDRKYLDRRHGDRLHRRGPPGKRFSLRAHRPDHRARRRGCRRHRAECQRAAAARTAAASSRSTPHPVSECILSPSEGIGRNVAEHVIDMLFPPGTPSRIPIISITGTNGKTTTTRLIAHILKGSGRTVGFTTTDGTYIGNQQIVTATTRGRCRRSSC